MTSIHISKILNAPELHILIFAFLLNFVWELLQMPLFAGFSLSSIETIFFNSLRHPGSNIVADV